MSNPILALTYASLLLATSFVLFRPDEGLFWQWQRQRQLTHRVLSEDALKHIYKNELINNVTSPFSLGYINLLGFIVFVPVTMIMARVGAKAVYKIDKKILSKIFGTFLIIVSLRSFIEYLNIN